MNLLRSLFAVLLLTAIASPGSGASFPDVKSFGAVGDGVADDTVAIQKAIDSVGKTGGTLFFPPGTYLVTSVGILPGVRYLGYGATIKRPPKQGKWVRTFNSAMEGYAYSGKTDSPLLTIEGLTFDGSREEQDEYRKYQLEQAHLIFLSADRGSEGRLRARVLNCQFENNVADGLSLYTNVDVVVDNCSARDCFRGGITITGGGSRIQISNFTAQGETHPTGIDVEVDGGGFQGSKKIELSINGMSLPNGDFDIAVSDGSIVLGSNISARAPFYLHGRNSIIRITNSTFGVGRFSEFSNRVVYPGNTSFQHCRFEIDGKSKPDEEPGKWAAIHVFWNVGKSKEQGQSLKFVDCEFSVGDGIADQDTTYAVYCEGDQAERDNRIVIDGGVISSSFDSGLWLNQGGSVRLHDVEIAAATPFRLGAASGWNVDAVIDGITVTGTNRYAEIPTHGAENRILHRNVEIDESVNQIVTKYGLTNNQYLGRRVIRGANPPTAATHGLVGDIYRLKTPRADQAFQWICAGTGAGSSAVWKPLPAAE